VRKGLILVLVALATTATCTAFAASIGLGTTKLGAGTAAIARCDANGFTVTPALSGSNVTAVVLGDIADPGCEGATVRVTLTNSSGTSISSAGPVTIVSDGDTSPNTQSVAVGLAVAESTVVGTRISVVGP
jgi:hypothetical protein